MGMDREGRYMKMGLDENASMAFTKQTHRA